MIGRTLTTVAIIGGGPGGLATAIALSELPFLQVTLYEQHPEPREAGAGISITTNAWKILDLLGAGDRVKGGSKANTYQRYLAKHHLNGFDRKEKSRLINPVGTLILEMF